MKCISYTLINVILPLPLNSMQEKKKILVTGGGGFIGSHAMVELMAAGFEPILVDNFSNSESFVLKRIEEIANQSFASYEVDCTDYNSFKRVFEEEKNIAGVIHFAAFKAVGESVEQPTKYYYNNLNSLTVLLKLMEEFGVKNLVFSSSCTVYGAPEIISIDESAKTQPAESPYGHTKQLCEEILQNCRQTSSVLLRYFNPVGAHESGLIGELPIGVPSNLIPFITQTAAGIREQLTIFGKDYNTPDGTCIRDFIHVVDLAKAHIAALNFLFEKELTEPAIFNVGSGTGSTVLECVKTFEKVSGKKLNYTFGERRSGDVEGIYAICDKAKNELNWETKLNLEDALKHAWQWQQNLSK